MQNLDFQKCIINQVTYVIQQFHTSHQRLKQCHRAQLAKIFTPFQQEFTINNNRISCQQHWNVIITAVIVLYLQCISNGIPVIMKLYCIQNFVLRESLYSSLPVMWSLVWHRLIKLHVIQLYTFQHCSDKFKLNKCTNLAINNQPMWIKSNLSLQTCTKACNLTAQLLVFLAI